MSDTESGRQPALSESDRVYLAARKAMREAVLLHARLGHPVSTMRDGKVVWLSPDEIFAMFASESPAAPRQKSDS